MSVNQGDPQVLAQMVMQLFDHWQLTTSDQCMLLGLEQTARTSLSRYREGQPIAACPDLLERCGHLLAIHKALRILYPENREVVYSWMTHPNKAFDDQRPLDFIRAHGLEGLVTVHRYLDSRRDR